MHAVPHLARRALPLGLVVGGALLAGCDRDPSAPSPTPATPQHIVITVPSTFTEVSAGNGHTCALRSDGVARCWGDDFWGQAPATRASATGTFTQVSAGGAHSCALNDSGAAECWGAAGGQAPALRTARTGIFTQLSAGSLHTCGLRSDGVVECWGRNTESQAPSTRAAASGTFVQVSGGQFHNCALRDDGVIECWGANNQGQAPATRTAASGTFMEVSGGGLHTCALRSDGVVECWGRAAVTKTPAVGTFTQVSAGGGFSCALRSDGAIECWGDDQSGQAPATRTAASGTYTKVTTGFFHGCATRSDGVVECWGSNEDGQAPATQTATGTTDIHILPEATFSAPASVIEGNPIALALTGAQVPGYPAAADFTYAFDCGSGYAAFSTTNTASCPSPAGPTTLTVRGTVRDEEGDAREYTADVEVLSVEQGIAQLGSEVETLVTAGDLNAGHGNALTTKLDRAVAHMEAGQYHVALNVLDAFVDQVGDFVDEGVLTPALGSALIGEANVLISTIQAIA